MSPTDLLQRTLDLNKEAKEFGFTWDNPHQLFKKIQEEYQEVLAVVDDPAQRAQLKEELGDLLHAVLSLCMICDLTPHEVLEGGLAKLKKRFDTMVELVRADGHTDFKSYGSMDDKLAYWRRAKEALGKEK